MTYKEELTKAMAALAADSATRFVGYGLTRGRAGGTMAGVAEAQIVETTVAENLMVGAAIGLSLRGCKPVVYIERADFLFNAMDAVVNHLDKVRGLSRWAFNPAVILRIVIGNSINPLFTGATHTQDPSDGLSKLVGFPVVRLTRADGIGRQYALARQLQEGGISTALFEYKDCL